MSNRAIGEDLVGLIKQIVREEVNKIIAEKTEQYAKARVVTVRDDGYYDVYVVESDKEVQKLENKTNKDLQVDDYVKIYYSQGNYANGYIGYKYE